MQKTTKQLTEIVDSYLSAYDSLDKLPVLVMPLAFELGLRLYKGKEWDNELSGMICRENDDGSEYGIYFNGKHSKNRIRFTIAHEIGHYVFHRTLIGDGLVDDALYRSGLSNLIEGEANRYAARILMPEALVRKATEKETDLKKLADMFHVSTEAMAIRLQVTQT